MAIILDGKAIANEIKAELSAEVESLRKMGIQPGLSVVLVGDDQPAQLYMKRLLAMANSLGIAGYPTVMSANSVTPVLKAVLQQLNANPDVHGILQLMPLPSQIDPDEIMATISPDKDIDCFSAYNVGNMMLGKTAHGPCTPMAVMEILRRSGFSLAGKHVVIIGRSNVVGKPLAMLMLQQNATVTLCHSKTTDLGNLVRQGDIVVAAVGKAGFITKDMIKPGAVVVDVGINVVNEKVVGDVDYENVFPIASAITPVPGGVGAVSNVMVMSALLRFCRNQYKKEETREP